MMSCSKNSICSHSVKVDGVQNLDPDKIALHGLVLTYASMRCYNHKCNTCNNAHRTFFSSNEPFYVKNV